MKKRIKGIKVLAVLIVCMAWSSSLFANDTIKMVTAASSSLDKGFNLMSNGYGYNGTFVIDWGDNTPIETRRIMGGAWDFMNNPYHTYSVAGTYTISVIGDGNFPDSAIQKIQCPNMELTGLDVRNSTELDNLDCKNNLLTSLDLSGNPNLMTLNCQNNLLTSLNLNSNPPVIGGYQGMQMLYCQDNKLTSLDLSDHPNLGMINCSGNQLSLSVLYALQMFLHPQCSKTFGTQTLETENISVGVEKDFTSETMIDGSTATVFDVFKNGSPAATPADYEWNNNKIKFNTSGDFTVEMTNGAITRTHMVIAPFAVTADDPSLKSLTVLPGGVLRPALNSVDSVYTVDTVINSINAITITAVTNDPAAQISGQTGAYPLIVGANVFTFTVTTPIGTTRTYKITVVRGIPDKDPSLSSLTVSVGTLTPAFNPLTKDYNVTVPSLTDDITIGATTSNPNAIITTASDTGTRQVASGFNTYRIYVDSEDGSVQWEYKVNVYKADASDANLSSLIPSEGVLTPAFDSAVTSYSISLANNITSIFFTATPNNPVASVVGDGFHSLSVGLNPITITVTAENGITTRTYTVNVTRAANATLQSLSVLEGAISPTFAPNTFSYNLSVGYEVDSVTISATANDPLSIVSGIGRRALSVGANPLAVVVTAVDNSQQTYTVNVTRAAAGTDVSLSDLTVSVGELLPVFDPSTTTYNVTVENSVSSLTITAVPNDSKATVSGDGLKQLTAGANNPFTITVTAEDGVTTGDYIVNIYREDGTGITSYNADNITLYPNPANDKLNIQSSDFAIEGIRIIDICGKVIYTSNSVSNPYSVELDVSSLSQGVYLIKIITNDRVIIKRVVKI